MQSAMRLLLKFAASRGWVDRAVIFCRAATSTSRQPQNPERIPHHQRRVPLAGGVQRRGSGFDDEGKRRRERHQRLALGLLARRAFRDKGVRAAILEKTEGLDFLSIDLNHDGKRDLIGTFEIGPATDLDKLLPAHELHRLFLIAIGDDAGNYRTDYVWYFHWADGMSENQTEDMRLVDTLDLDEDGIDEVITSTIGYEGNEYQILKRGRNGKWTIVYRGGGSGC